VKASIKTATALGGRPPRQITARDMVTSSNQVQSMTTERERYDAQVTQSDRNAECPYTALAFAESKVWKGGCDRGASGSSAASGAEVASLRLIPARDCGWYRIVRHRPKRIGPLKKRWEKRTHCTRFSVWRSVRDIIWSGCATLKCSGLDI
jgi:hypothetical protein